MARKLRIAVSVFFGLLTVALCVLWVRSYSSAEAVQLATPKHRYQLGYYSGGVYLGVTYAGPAATHRKTGFSTVSMPASDELSEKLKEDSVAGFRFTRTFNSHLGKNSVASMPFLVPVVLSIAMAFSIRSSFLVRFSLRSMLIITTLVAVVLGLAVWAAG